MPAVYLGQVFDTIKLVLNKERKGSVRDAQIVTALRIGSLNYFGRQLMEYRAGAEVPSTLRQQKFTAPVAIAAGVGPLPADFAKEVSFVMADPDARDGEFLSAAEFSNRLKSLLLPPSPADPIGKVEGNQVLIAPTANIILTYIKKPVEFVYVQTIDADGRGTTPNLATSTDLDFPQECLPDIIKEALMFLGVKQQDNDVIELGATAKE
jgi:hypothetical protein